MAGHGTNLPHLTRGLGEARRVVQEGRRRGRDAGAHAPEHVHRLVQRGVHLRGDHVRRESRCYVEELGHPVEPAHCAAAVLVHLEARREAGDRL